jgi:hypothetical protein
MKPSKLALSSEWIAAIALSLSVCLMNSCSPAEVQTVTSDIGTALADLEANKTLAEESVREVKRTMPMADPHYQSIMEAYEQAREDYNGYLSQVEMAAKMGQALPVGAETTDGVNRSATAFIQGTSAGLDWDVRGLKLNRAIVLPSKLSRLPKLPRSVRTAISDRIATDLHWKSWSQL